MKFIVSSSNLLKQVNSIISVIPPNPVVPILENFLFEIKSGALKITASDMQTSIITHVEIEASPEDEASIAVPAKILADTLKNLPEQPVTFTIDTKESFSIELSSDNGRYKLGGENAVDYPKMPELTQSSSVEIPSGVLQDAMAYTLFATSNDEMKMAMNGVYFNINETNASFVASDSHRLIRYRREDLTAEGETSLIVHKKALTLLKSSLPSEDVIIKMDYTSSNAVFSFDNVKLICRLIDERFPDYENVIPLGNDNLVTIDRQELLSSLKRLVIYANKSTNQVRFKITGNEMQVSSEDLTYSNEATERLFCDHDGPDLEIGFNAKFMLEILNNLYSEKIVLKLSEPSSAGLVTPEESVEGEDILMLIMPIMLHNYV
ncbi:DNA polymerase III subunit beta [Flammeovirgaceae bacterium SG7u.111]|nr:DNA polymerase III subunit beta [Flammeovirgaceae bacterium SG7u.132]WPO36625.1 DNA polymerase III subunit beta [Flammeovirgaceae bacterium SG7u.111]